MQRKSAIRKGPSDGRFKERSDDVWLERRPRSAAMCRIGLCADLPLAAIRRGLGAAAVRRPRPRTAGRTNYIDSRFNAPHREVGNAACVVESATKLDSLLSRQRCPVVPVLARPIVPPLGLAATVADEFACVIGLRSLVPRPANRSCHNVIAPSKSSHSLPPPPRLRKVT
ncbi:hypothetical protein P280DRAFT_477170 [Massarina eburnea CBS 473.64]|uniref:Uncharacterized protein n=1 Tax=Massarina eburnea CBS 473.64 TaxID=1395130 RepID=A0A6A6S7X4_9PLEO|nr:hypothetical protein P280DRAFT_477170 [Massarina eburnea CBS 473.64]